jgi:triacylglycerol lipase
MISFVLCSGPLRWALMTLAAYGAASSRASGSSGAPQENAVPKPAATLTSSATMSTRETIVLVHGLGRTRLSLNWLSRQFEKAGYTVINIGYPSTRMSIAESARHVRGQLTTAFNSTEGRLHFVTHSLGGIIVRQLLRDHRPVNLGRVVMLAPPNQGSEVTDRLAKLRAYRWATGPAGQELGTDPSSTPNLLGPVDYEVGIIAGRASLNPVFSAWIQGPNDGKVSVARATVAGLRDLFVVRRSHTFLMLSREVAAQSLHFIARGQFQHPSP